MKLLRQQNSRKSQKQTHNSRATLSPALFTSCRSPCSPCAFTVPCDSQVSPFLGSSTKESTDLTTTVFPNGLHKPDNVPAYQGLLPGWSATPSGQGRHLQMVLENTIAAFKLGGSLSMGCGDHLAPASSSQPHPRQQLDWSPQGAQVHAVPNLPAAASQRNRVGKRKTGLHASAGS